MFKRTIAAVALAAATMGVAAPAQAYTRHPRPMTPRQVACLTGHVVVCEGYTQHKRTYNVPTFTNTYTQHTRVYDPSRFTAWQPVTVTVAEPVTVDPHALPYTGTRNG